MVPLQIVIKGQEDKFISRETVLKLTPPASLRLPVSAWQVGQVGRCVAIQTEVKTKSMSTLSRKLRESRKQNLEEFCGILDTVVITARC